MKFRLKVLTVFLLLICGFAFAEDFNSIKSMEPVFIEENSSENSIIIETVQPKCEVYLNGVYQGQTNLKINGLLPGEYIIELKKKGESFGKFYVTVKRGYILTYRFE